jgi:hypothetical protein
LGNKQCSVHSDSRSTFFTNTCINGTVLSIAFEFYLVSQ